ncbi:hypothetical protein B0H21DRAFT_725128 [Amylocystis lapponica]|nr:hypothetical protein B0H21DRAFT_725128 [Amylocystis lapponica]
MVTPEPGFHISEQLVNDLLNLQGTEIVRLQAELLEAKNEIGTLKDRLYHAHEIDGVHRELMELRNRVEQLPQNSELKAVRDELMIVKEDRENLRDQCLASEHALSMARNEIAALLREHAQYQVARTTQRYEECEAGQAPIEEQLNAVSSKAAGIPKANEDIRITEKAVCAVQEAKAAEHGLVEQEMKDETPQLITTPQSTAKVEQQLLASDLDDSQLKEIQVMLPVDIHLTS